MAVVSSGSFLGCGPEKRPEQSMDQLLAARRADDEARAAELRQLQGGLMTRIRAKVDAYQASTRPTTAPASATNATLAGATTRPTVDLLVISGGGDWGAFGAGVLKGWSKVQGDMARPQFDIVTGVSTGALIAPFAFLGDDASIERVVQLYRNPKEDWAKSRGILFFWPTNPSFYKLPGLERE